MGRVDLGRRRLLRRNVARGPVPVLLVLGFIRVSAVATLPPRPEADLADHAGARVLRRAAFVLWERLLDGVRRGRALALPADAELMAQAGGRLQTPRPTRPVAELVRDSTTAVLFGPRDE